MKAFFSLTKILFLIVVFVFATSKPVAIDQDIPKLIGTSETSTNPQSNFFSNKNEEVIDCEGNWVRPPKTGNINLQTIPLANWGADTPPTIVKETLNTDNIVIIGHNLCVNNNCFKSGSRFGQIIDVRVGDLVDACINQKYYRGYVFISQPISEYQTGVMGNWTGFKTITMFTSYGNCKNSHCSSTDQRWLIAFERN